MKQHITIEQLNELDRKQRRKLELWCFTHGYFTRYNVPGEPTRFSDTKTFTSYVIDPMELSIGQMIEFLDEQERCDWVLDGRSGYIELHWKDHSHTIIQWDKELCDALWEAVKEVLEK